MTHPTIRKFRKFRTLKISAHSHPLVRELYEVMNEEEMGVLELSDRSGINKNTLKDWKHRTVPTITNIEAAGSCVGLKLIWKKVR